MPETRFRVRWPDRTESVCYSPSSVVREHLRIDHHYEVGEFLDSVRVALDLASQRVRAKYGFACSAASDQLAAIEARVRHLEASGDARIVVLAFEPPA